MPSAASKAAAADPINPMRMRHDAKRRARVRAVAAASDRRDRASPGCGIPALAHVRLAPCARMARSICDMAAMQPSRYIADSRSCWNFRLDATGRGRSDMSVNPGDVNPLQSALAQSIREHWVLFLVEGIVLVVLGFLAIVVPVVATIAVTIFLGWLFLISGIVGLVTTFWARHAPGFWWSLLSAVLAIAAGLVLLGWPISGAVSLTLLLIVFFTIEGILSIIYAFEHKKELSGRWGWMLVSGIVDLILAAIILAGLPGTAAWALGLLVGINMLFGGSALIAMALHARSSATSTPPAPRAA